MIPIDVPLTVLRIINSSEIVCDCVCSSSERGTYDASELEFDNVSSNSERVMYYVIV